MSSNEVAELKELPLEHLISAPLNAVINAQANAALSTAAFIERIAFKPDAATGDTSLSALFDNNTQKYSVRTAEVKLVKKGVDAAGVATSTDVMMSLPFVSLVNVPSVEIDEMTWDFNVRLKRAEVMTTTFTVGNTTTATSNSNFNLSLGKLVTLGSSLKVESTTKVDAATKFGLSKDSEYNMKISVKASQAAPPKGIEKLLSIVESLMG